MMLMNLFSSFPPVSYTHLDVYKRQPGDLQSKVDPYLRPLYDALYQIMGPDSFAKNMEKGLIEVAPLAYMRGRTLDNAFIILDEAQNTTPAQMKMFLTQTGFLGAGQIFLGGIASHDDFGTETDTRCV